DAWLRPPRGVVDVPNLVPELLRRALVTPRWGNCAGAGPVTRSLFRRRALPETEQRMNGVNLAHKLATFSEHYRPRTVGQFNGHDLMVVKLKGPFTWHRHEDT